MKAKEQGWTHALVQKLTMGMQKMLHVCVNHRQFGACCKAAARCCCRRLCCCCSSCSRFQWLGLQLQTPPGHNMFRPKTSQLHLKADLCKITQPASTFPSAAHGKRLYSPPFPELCFALSVPSADLDPPKRWLSTFPGAMNALYSGG